MGVQFAGNILIQADGGPLPIANGGTGQTTAPTAINALLPVQTGNSGKILTTDGSNVYWASGGSGASAAGSDTQVQYNDSGNFGSNAGLTVNKTTGALTTTSSLTSESSNITGAVLTYRTIHYQTTGSDRWLMQANNSAENGTGLGSNFEFVRVADNGSTQNIVYSVARNTGVLDFKVTPTINGTAVSTGTVTSVSVISANGISGTVANSSTTPAITLNLGAITPSSIASTGSISGTTISGTTISGTSLAITNSLSVAGDSGTSGYLLSSGGPGNSPLWIPNTGPTSLSATGAEPSFNNTAGVYAGIYNTVPRLDIYNFTPTAGNRRQYYQVNNDGSTSLGFTDMSGNDNDWLTVTRNQGVAPQMTFTANAASFSGSISGSGTGITNLNASNLASGTVPTARLASGTASSSNYLRGDQTWAPIPTTVSSVSVVTANGISGTVATPNSTPAITLNLGDITPSSVSTGNLTTTGTITVGGTTGNAGQVLESNGTSAPTWTDKVYEVALSITAVPPANQIFLTFVSTVSWSLPLNLTGSMARASTTATSSTSLLLKKNGTQIGTVNFASGATSGTFTFSTATSFSAGDVLTIVAPSTPDTTLSNVGITLKGTYV